MVSPKTSRAVIRRSRLAGLDDDFAPVSLSDAARNSAPEVTVM
jgi:hypothetical protein